MSNKKERRVTVYSKYGSVFVIDSFNTASSIAGSTGKQIDNFENRTETTTYYFNPDNIDCYAVTEIEYKEQKDITKQEIKWHLKDCCTEELNLAAFESEHDDAEVKKYVYGDEQ